MEGQGKLTLANGKCCAGKWQDNKLIDKGTAMRDGKTVKCHFRRGKIVYSK